MKHPDGYLGLWESMEPIPPRPTLNRCPMMRRVWELLAESGVTKEERRVCSSGHHDMASNGL